LEILERRVKFLSEKSEKSLVGDTVIDARIILRLVLKIPVQGYMGCGLNSFVT